MKQFVIITGIGRSGTSLMGKILYNLGYEFGKLNKKDAKFSIKGKTGYFEDIVLGRATHLWELAIYGNKVWANTFFIPISNRYEGLNPIKKLIYRIGDNILKKELSKNKNKEFFVMKRYDAILWIWKISVFCY